jgi:dienelactone hydrolase
MHRMGREIDHLLKKRRGYTTPGMRFHAALLGVLATLIVACSGSKSGPGGDEPEPSPKVDPPKNGPYVVGTTGFELEAHDSRTLPVQVWYPAVDAAREEATAGHPFAAVEPPGQRHDQLAALVDAAPAGCTSRLMHAAIDAPAAERSEAWPVVLFSHCDSCARYSELTVAERLASWGFVVAAPDHTENTIYDAISGGPTHLTPEFLQVRGKDVKDVLDAVLAGADGVPEGLGGHLDESRIGMFGHSFGSITTGLVLQDDPRVKAGAMIAAPPENPILTGVSIANLTKPGLFFLAEEDNAIGVAANELIQQNYESYPNPAWLVSVKDAGHWSFSDIAGMAPFLAPGCGQGERQIDPTQTFTYVDNDVGREVAASYVTAFLAAELLDDSSASKYLSEGMPEDVVKIEHR